MAQTQLRTACIRIIAQKHIGKQVFAIRPGRVVHSENYAWNIDFAFIQGVHADGAHSCDSIPGYVMRQSNFPIGSRASQYHLGAGHPDDGTNSTLRLKIKAGNIPDYIDEIYRPAWFVRAKPDQKVNPLYPVDATIHKLYTAETSTLEDYQKVNLPFCLNHIPDWTLEDIVDYRANAHKWLRKIGVLENELYIGFDVPPGYTDGKEAPDTSDPNAWPVVSRWLDMLDDEDTSVGDVINLRNTGMPMIQM
ncbi:MAG: hypothetical protein RR382_00095 [Tannerellaceae bacterium]